MLGRTPATISAIRPLKDGVIADFDVTEQMLRHFIRKAMGNKWAHPRIVICVPSGVTGVEKRAVEEATYSAGARWATLIEEPMAAAIGAGLPVAEPTGNMIVDIGGGTSEVAVISLGGIVVSQSIRVGGDELDEAIISYVKKEYKLLIGSQTAEEIKLEIGSAYPLPQEEQAEIRGRDLVTGLPKTIVLSSEEVRTALEEPVQAIIDAIKATLDKTPPELASDIMDRGIMLAGGGSLLQGLAERLRNETQMPVHLAESPLTCVAVGSGKYLEEFDAIAKKQAQLQAERPLARLSRSLHRPSNRRGPQRRLIAAILVLLSVALLTLYFREADDGVVHRVQEARCASSRRCRTARARAIQPFRDGWNWVADLFDAKSREPAPARRGRALRGSRRQANSRRRLRTTSCAGCSR